MYEASFFIDNNAGSLAKIYIKQKMQLCCISFYLLPNGLNKTR